MDGKVALVTGAGRGIGRSTALLLAREGARVMVNDLGCDAEGLGADLTCSERVADEIREAGGEAEFDGSDVSDPDAVEALVRRTVERFGALDVLINNAGIGSHVPMGRLGSAAFRRVIDVQLAGTYHGLRHASAVMKAAGSGSIVNTTSVTGLRGNWGQAHAAAAASGVVGLTLTASVELQRHGVRVNAVAPVAKTRLTANLPMFAEVDSMLPEHVAPAYAFLASDLSREVTGNILTCAGGKLSLLRVSESPGALKEEGEGVWTPAEISEHWSAISKR